MAFKTEKSMNDMSNVAVIRWVTTECSAEEMASSVNRFLLYKLIWIQCGGKAPFLGQDLLTLLQSAPALF